MTQLDPHAPLPAINTATLIVAAARVWQAARRDGHVTQPALARTLATYDGLMLIPVLDGLMHVYETALGRAIEIAETAHLSRDEHVLLALVEGAQSHACLACSDGVARTLRCALCSTRTMLAVRGLAPGAAVATPRLH